ncbi:MAG: hypothetical protein KDJ39_06585 [Gammaproteobacteria bacterium]|nr:hypothetical protein [Gammaproteobacteria bacterium]
MRRLAYIACCTLLAVACAPVQQKPEAPTTRAPERPKAEFDGIAALGQTSPPDRDAIREKFRYDRSIRTTAYPGLRYYFYDPERRRSVVGFAFENTGSPKVNPVGLKKTGARREYAFMFADRARENIYLAVNDDVKLSGRFSHDNMFRELHFFPRRQLPSLAIDNTAHQYRVTLPTGEPVLFDQDTLELAGGVLREAPIDFNRSRHQRHNPEVRYQGQYLAITVAQRGEAPRRARVWGQTKFAEAYYPAKYRKPCRLSPAHIWDQRPKRGDTDPTLQMLFKTDAQLFATVERQCGWDLSALKGDAPVLVKASD